MVENSLSLNDRTESSIANLADGSAFTQMAKLPVAVEEVRLMTSKVRIPDEAGKLTVRVQSMDAVEDPIGSLAMTSRTLSSEFIASAGETTFQMPTYEVPPGDEGVLITVEASIRDDVDGYFQVGITPVSIGREAEEGEGE